MRLIIATRQETSGSALMIFK